MIKKRAEDRKSLSASSERRMCETANDEAELFRFDCLILCEQSRAEQISFAHVSSTLQFKRLQILCKANVNIS